MGNGVTLALCTYNGRNELYETLKHIDHQEDVGEVEWELLVVDNNSTDGTADYIRELWPDEKESHLRIVQEKRQGIAFARKRALREAKYEYLSFVDDDNWISENWIRRIYGLFESHPNVGIISCPSKARLDHEPPSHFEIVKGWLAVGEQCEEEGFVEERPVSFWTAGCSFRVAPFRRLAASDYESCLTGRTKDETLGGEDHEFCLALTLMGWDVYFTKDISIKHNITEDQCSREYILDLVENGGKSRPILDIYRNEYRDRLIENPHLSVVYYLKEYLDKALRHWLKKCRSANGKLLYNQISHALARGRLKGYWMCRDQFARAKENLRILKAIRDERSV
ncbi:glycosyltransferase [Salinibacter sp.]|jgi:glycosyltransferase involved in cell wall biosynthesis|uniref:glycosyltransferase n=1 Tax=Salinibacter sp. TaxID=2065818 RepID=UPI0021E98AA7|nr:glycosyltransferase [Salinibacter sp.]